MIGSVFSSATDSVPGELQLLYKILCQAAASSMPSGTLADASARYLRQGDHSSNILTEGAIVTSFVWKSGTARGC